MMDAELLYLVIVYIVGGVFSAFIGINFLSYAGYDSDDVDGMDYVMILIVAPLVWPVSIPLFLVGIAGVWLQNRIYRRSRRAGKSILDRLFDLVTVMRSK